MEDWAETSEMQPPVPEVQQPVPEVQQPVPEVQQPVPEVQQPVPEVQQPTPAVQQPVPVIQQPVTVDPAVLLEMVRAMVREIVGPPQADAGSAPVAQPVPAPAVQTPTAEVRSEGHVDWVKEVG